MKIPPFVKNTKKAELWALQPADIPVVTNLDALEHRFVTTEKRARLFDNYQQYTQALIKIIGLENLYFQWLNGSFVTSKMEPNDIDLVSFMDGDIKEACSEEIKTLNTTHKPIVDAYTVGLYSENHPLHKRGQNDMADWKRDFMVWTHKKSDKSLENIGSKNFIQLNFSNHGTKI
jgi:hypothetical protein